MNGRILRMACAKPTVHTNENIVRGDDTHVPEAIVHAEVEAPCFRAFAHCFLIRQTRTAYDHAPMTVIDTRFLKLSVPELNTDDRRYNISTPAGLQRSERMEEVCSGQRATHARSYKYNLHTASTTSACH